MNEWVEEAEGRVLVLFGAGASKPNLPTSVQLLEQVTDYLDAQLTNEDITNHRLWRAIRPQLEQIKNESGNIEDAYEAVRTLTYQESDPTRYWIDGFTPFDIYPDTDEGRRARAWDANVLCDFLRSRSIDFLAAATKDAPLEHFEPLLRAPKVAIATLNYDDLLEQAAKKFRVPLSTGSEEWDGGFLWQFPDGAQRLIKVHGSYLWRAARVLNEGVGGLPNIGLYEVAKANDPSPGPKRMDAPVMFGAGLKLTADGPFPALMRSFTDHLQEADLLVVVGYRFADEHINATIRRWAALDASRRIIIVDPSPNLAPDMLHDSYGGLLHGMWDGYREPKSGVSGFIGSGGGPNRIQFIQEGVVEALPALFA